ncbi:unnamed protein product [Meganyctiphanes norvegica]|uniref:Uncharacterized protein n=1 Tax=Meganyctiphanes norvegica TaxID=48144 RepID=A0AAV2PK63_MEGNR
MLTADCGGGQQVQDMLLTKQPLCLMKACIQLPYGSYNISALQEADGGGGEKHFAPLLATSFGIPYLDRFEWEKIESRSKHAIKEDTAGYKPEVDCRMCLIHNHSYNPNLALLTFNYSCREDPFHDYCCEQCTSKITFNYGFPLPLGHRPPLFHCDLWPQQNKIYLRLEDLPNGKG